MARLLVWFFHTRRLTYCGLLALSMAPIIGGWWGVLAFAVVFIVGTWVGHIAYWWDRDRRGLL